MRLNGEAFLAGIDLDTHQNTEDAGQAGDYDELRALPAEELRPMLRVFAEDWIDTIQIQAGVRAPLSLEAVEVAPAGDLEVPRESYLDLTASLPPGA